MKNYLLETIYDSRASFYGKARVVETENRIELYSYETLVLTIENGKPTLNTNIREDLLLSNTTLRHIKEFLKQNGFNAENKNQILKDYKN